MKKRLFLIRGIPGSGKTSLAEDIAEKICSADDYHIVNGEYVFNPAILHKAHAWCERKCERYMKCGVSKIAVANVFSKESHLKPYIELAYKYNYRVYSIIVENRHGNVNIHGVDEKTINKMINRFNIKLK